MVSSSTPKLMANLNLAISWILRRRSTPIIWNNCSLERVIGFLRLSYFVFIRSSMVAYSYLMRPLKK